MCVTCAFPAAFFGGYSCVAHVIEEGETSLASTAPHFTVIAPRSPAQMRASVSNRPIWTAFITSGNPFQTL